jgi:hypothetical protein
VTAPQGQINYRAANDYNRNGAAEDEIVFRPADLTKPRVAIVLPGANADATARVQRSVEFSFSDGKATLAFRRPDGQPANVEAVVKP